MGKELRIGVPGAGPGSGVPAFAVSRDSAGILIAVRDNAAPQFAVSRDSGGLLLSAWPVTPSGTFHSLHLHAAFVGSAYAPQDAAVGEVGYPDYPLFMGAGEYGGVLYAIDGMMKFDTSTLPAEDLGAEPTAARLWLRRSGSYGHPPDMEIRLGTDFGAEITASDWKTTAEYLALTLLGTYDIDELTSTDFAASQLNMDGDTFFYLSWIGRDGDPAGWPWTGGEYFCLTSEDLYLEVDYGTP